MFLYERIFYSIRCEHDKRMSFNLYRIIGADYRFINDTYTYAKKSYWLKRQQDRLIANEQ